MPSSKDTLLPFKNDVHLSTTAMTLSTFKKGLTNSQNYCDWTKLFLKIFNDGLVKNRHHNEAFFKKASVYVLLSICGVKTNILGFSSQIPEMYTKREHIVEMLKIVRFLLQSSEGEKGLEHLLCTSISTINHTGFVGIDLPYGPSSASWAGDYFHSEGTGGLTFPNALHGVWMHKNTAGEDVINSLYNILNIESLSKRADILLAELDDIYSVGGFSDSVVKLNYQLGGDVITELAKLGSASEIYSFILRHGDCPKEMSQAIIELYQNGFATYSTHDSDVNFKIGEVIPESMGKYENKWKRDPEGHLEIRLIGSEYKDGVKVVKLSEYFSMKSGQESKALVEHSNYPHFNTSCWMSGNNAFNNEECLKQIVDMNLWKHDQSIINQMTPLVAYSIVKSLQFKGIKDTERELIRVQTADDWWDSLEEEHKKILNIQFSNKINPVTGTSTADTWSALYARRNSMVTTKNMPLIKFLNNIVSFINSNPEILNTTPIISEINLDPRTGVYKVGFAPHNKRLVNQPLFKIREHINLATNFVGVRMSGLVNSVIPGVKPNVFLPGYVGGSEDDDDDEDVDLELEGGVGHEIPNLPHFHDQLKALYDSLVMRLAASNKKLSSTTEKSIMDVFNNFKQKEIEVRNIIRHFEAYVKQINSSQDKTPEPLTKSNLKTAYEKFGSHMNKYRRRAISLTDILSAVSTAADDNDGKYEISMNP